MAKYHSVLFAGLFITALAGCSSSQTTTSAAPQPTVAAPMATADAAGKLQVNPKDFEAWLSVMPGSPHSLHVEGKMGAVTAPSTGWTVELADGPQGKNKRTKVLQLQAAAPDVGGDVMTPMDVPPYVEDPAAADYTRVTIWHGGKSFTIRVRRAH